MNVLYFSPIRLLPKGHGNIATVHQHILRLHALGHKVHYVYLNEDCSSVENLFCSQLFVDTFDVIENKANPQRDSQGYYCYDTKYFDGLGEKIRELCLLYSINVVICSYVFHSKIFEFVPKNILKILDTHDRMTDRHMFLRKNKIKDEFFSCTESDEIKYLSRADVIWARRDEETKFFNRITQSKKAITVSHFDNPNFLSKKISQLRTIGFLASDNEVNYKMVISFIDEFVKQYKSNPIDVKLIIGGRVKNMFEARKECPLNAEVPVEMIGVVKEVEDFYKKVDAVVVPIVFGTAINVKMIEAMSFGVPIVSTVNGIKGVDSRCQYHNAESLHELINLIWMLYRNPKDLIMLETLSKNIFDAFFQINSKSFDSCFRS